jgi:copper transport protein
MARHYRLLFLALLLPLLLPAGRASAHASLVRSQPAAGTVLESAPGAVELEYSEPLDSSFSEVQLLSSAGEVVAAGPGAVDDANDHVLRLALGALPNGTYTAVWRARSSVDGHVTNGSVGFSVGRGSPAAALLPPPGAPEPATAPPQALDALLRWLSYAAAALLAGGLSFAVLVWGPAWRQSRAAPDADARASALFRRLALVGAAGLAATTALFALNQAALAGEVPLWRAGGPLLALLTGRTGALLGVRLALLLALALGARRLPDVGGGRQRPWIAALAITGLALLTFSLQGHGAADGDWLAVALDWLHLAAMGAWLGGIVPLALLLARRDAAGVPASTLVPRFSAVALVSVATLALSGAYAAWIHVGDVEALLSTTYGRALLVKLGIFAALGALGALNLLAFSPRLKRSGAAAWLRRSVRAELALGAALLLAAGTIMAVSPARTALDAQRRLGLSESAQSGEVSLALRVAPGAPGDNEFGIDVRDDRPGAAQADGEVLLRLSMVGHDMGTTQVEAQPGEGGRYTARGSYLSMSGLWRVEVIVRRAGFDDVRQQFDLPIRPGNAAASP